MKETILINSQQDKVSKRKPVIVCVDDEKIVLDSIYRQLQRRFKNRYEYEFAESAEEALDVISELIKDDYTIIMVICDQLMPGMKGDEFLSQLYQRYPEVVSILLTGQASLQSAINLINNANLFRYITKPWEEHDLLLTIEKGIDQYFLTVDKQKQLELFYKFIPAQFLEKLAKQNILDIGLGDSVRQEMTIMFADIYDFTSLSEKLTPEENFEFINAYLQYVEPPIVANQGFVDKYMGDAILALFNTPENALKAALQMQKAVDKHNEDRKQKNLVPIKIGIGLCLGQIMLGVVGVKDRMQTTVISDVVNLASRLEGLSKIFDSSIVVTKHLLDKLPDAMQINARFLGKIIVKGRTQEVLIYEILIPDNELSEKKIKTKSEFQEGLELYFNKKFSEASVKFNNVIKTCADDHAAQYYLRRCALHMVEGVPENWTGVLTMLKKDDMPLM